jgi:hypothetical protein
VLAPPYTLYGSVITLPLPFWRSATTFGSVGAPLKPTGERYNAMMVFLRERYLLWAAVGLLRRMGKRYFQYWKEVGFKSLFKP